jgi:CRP/FNR family transcriptional regulator, cyclic AMP receptor protein
MDDILKKLKEKQIFRTLSDDMLNSLAAIVKEESGRAGQSIYREGDEATAMYLVQTGEVEIRKRFRKNPDKSKILTIAEEGDFFGELAFFGKARRSADAVARTDTQLWKLDYNDLIRINRGDPASAVNVLQALLRMLVPKLNSLIEEHAVLFELGRLLPKIQDVEELTRAVFDLVRDTVETEDTGMIAVFNVFNEEFDVYQSTEHIRERHLEHDHPVARELLKTKSAWIVKNTGQDERFKGLSYLGCSFIAAPVLYEDDLKGLIILANSTTENAFRNSHMIFIQTACTLMGEKLHDIERKQEEILKKRLDRGKFSADI